MKCLSLMLSGISFILALVASCLACIMLWRAHRTFKGDDGNDDFFRQLKELREKEGTNHRAPN